MTRNQGVAAGGDETLLKPGEAAEFLGVHPVTLRRWVREGHVTALRLPTSQRMRFRRSDLLKALERGGAA